MASVLSATHMCGREQPAAAAGIEERKEHHLKQQIGNTKQSTEKTVACANRH
jgi:hypothetical protein